MLVVSLSLVCMVHGTFQWDICLQWDAVNMLFRSSTVNSTCSKQLYPHLSAATNAVDPYRSTGMRLCQMKLLLQWFTCSYLLTCSLCGGNQLHGGTATSRTSSPPETMPSGIERPGGNILQSKLPRGHFTPRGCSVTDITCTYVYLCIKQPKHTLSLSVECRAWHCFHILYISSFLGKKHRWDS